MAKQLKFQQIIAGHFLSSNMETYNGSHVILGLSEDGKVYRYDAHCEGWIPWPMVAVTCRENHPGRR